MVVKVIIEEKNINDEIEFSGEVSLIALRYGYSIQEVVFKVNGKIVPDDYDVKDGDVVEVIRVVYAG